MHADEHTNSYYAATRTPVEFPALDGGKRADVAIVGAGFTGTSAALSLAERGYKVALVEANRVGWGASGRNGGQLIHGFVSEEKMGKLFGPDAASMAYRMGIEGRDIVVDRIERYGIDCDLRFGFLDVASKRKDIRDLRESMDHLQANDYPHHLEMIPAERMREYVGSDMYHGGLVNMGDGHLHPMNLCLGEAQAAAALGARIFEQSPVVRVVHGENPRVETASGHIDADKIILAGNAYLGKTEPRLYGSVVPATSYIIATEPLSDELATELIPSDMACCDQRVGLDYYRLSPDRRMLFGGTCRYSGTEPRSITNYLRPKMLRVFPQLSDAKIDFEWGGKIAICVKRIPQFGRIENNTYYAQGYSGHGLAPTHIAGKVLADIVSGESEAFELFSKVKHLHLPGGKWFANPAVALGMLYYRLKDLL